MVDLHDQHARKFWADPLLVKLIRLFLLNAVIAGDMKTLAVVRLQVRIGRPCAKVVETFRKMVVEDDEREVRLRMLVKTFRHEHNRRQVYGASPEFRQQRALNLQVTNVPRVLRFGNGWNFLIE